MSTNCTNVQKSLGWCEGKTTKPGIRRRLYYISKSQILKYPELEKDESGRVVSANLVGSFLLKADSKWKYIDVVPNKSGVKSDPEGDYPNQLQKNTLTAVHPGTDESASAAAAYLNNTDCCYLFQDTPGNYRMIGSEEYQTKSTVTQDLGNGPTGEASTTIVAESYNEVPAPFYHGEIITEDGTIDLSESGEQGEEAGEGT